MIGYVTLGTNDLERSAAFYDELLALMGAGRFMEEEAGFIAWAVAPDKPAISITRKSGGGSRSSIQELTSSRATTSSSSPWTTSHGQLGCCTLENS